MPHILHGESPHGKTVDPNAVVVVGSTGRLGRRVVELAAERGMTLAGLAVGSDVALAARQVEQHDPQVVWMREDAQASHLGPLAGGARTAFISGKDRLVELANLDAATLVVCIPSLDALELTGQWLSSGRRAVVASKELLVAAGGWLQAQAPAADLLVPLDSELTAATLLWRRTRGRVRRLVLPASGGPFLGMDSNALRAVTPAQALNHPVWRMGPKVTVDSATLLNKGFELLAARSLFGLGPDQLGALIHREGLVHAMVLDETGAWLWQAGPTTMDWAIEYALLGQSETPPLEPTGMQLEFSDVPPPFRRGIDIAMAAMAGPDTMQALLVGADDALVDAFLSGRIELPMIWRLLEQVLLQGDPAVPVGREGMEGIRAVVEQGRTMVGELLAGSSRPPENR